jgi:cytoskeletal protein CcmA (bactofilin family)
MSIFNKKSAPASADSAIPAAVQSNDAISATTAENVEVAALGRSLESSHQELLNDEVSRGGVLNLKPNSKPSILSNGFEFEGVIKSDGVLNISSSLKGKVFAKSIFLDVDGVVEGEIQAEVLTIKGKIYGEIHCQDLTVGSRAVIDGTCYYRTLNIQRGGRVSGKLSRID